MVSKSRSLKRKVYLISPNKIYPNFFTDLEKVLSSQQISFFQLRLKNNNKNQIIKIAKKIKPITKKFKVKFLINDSYKIAKKVSSDGCHLGQSDENIHSAKKNLKNTTKNTKKKKMNTPRNTKKNTKKNSKNTTRIIMKKINPIKKYGGTIIKIN